MFPWPPFTRGGRSRERSPEAEEKEARPEVGGDGQDGVGGRAGQEVGPVPGGLRRQAGYGRGVAGLKGRARGGAAEALRAARSLWGPPHGTSRGAVVLGA